MKAVGYLKSLAIAEPESLIDFAADLPQPAGRDLRVAVKAVSVNPVDTKVRLRAAPKPGEPPKILGYDAAGVVEAVGPEVTLFKPGDEVFYAGSIARPGSNAELHLVDERIVGRKPASLSFAQAAALPLTSITAWELLFDRLAVTRGNAPDGRALLVIGGAGGVGSIMIQLARKLTGLDRDRHRLAAGDARLVREARRPSRRRPYQAAGRAAEGGRPSAQVALIASLTGTEQHYPAVRRRHRAAGQVRPDRRPARASTSTCSSARRCRCIGNRCSRARSSRRPT